MYQDRNCSKLNVASKHLEVTQFPSSNLNNKFSMESNPEIYFKSDSMRGNRQKCSGKM